LCASVGVLVFDGIRLAFSMYVSGCVWGEKLLHHNFPH